jgi:hypothetical protein
MSRDGGTGLFAFIRPRARNIHVRSTGFGLTYLVHGMERYRQAREHMVVPTFELFKAQHILPTYYDM